MFLFKIGSLVNHLSQYFSYQCCYLVHLPMLLSCSLDSGFGIGEFLDLVTISGDELSPLSPLMACIGNETCTMELDGVSLSNL